MTALALIKTQKKKLISKGGTIVEGNSLFNNWIMSYWKFYWL